MTDELLKIVELAKDAMGKRAPEIKMQVSGYYFQNLRASLPESNETFFISGIPVTINPLFPVTLNDGTICHGVIISEPENDIDLPDQIYLIEKPSPTPPAQ